MKWALLIGVAIGSIPTADLIARLKGFDLRSEGSGNPGTANALRVVGRGAAVAILLLDLLKGAGAALVGLALEGDAAGAGAAVAAIGGQVMNPWFGFRGGKGLGVTGGTLLVLWPIGLVCVIPLTALAAALFRAAYGGMLGVLALLGLGVLWASEGWTTVWGITADDTLVWYTIGIVVLTAPKLMADIADRWRS